MATIFQNIGTNIYNYFVTEDTIKKFQLLEPLTCIIKLCILNLKDKGTKLQIINNSIKFQEPDLLQGTNRWINGDTRSDLHNLCNPIQIALEWYNPNDSDELKYIYNNALLGIDSLGKAYNIDTISSLVANTISHYKILIQSGIDNSKFIGDNNISDTNSEIEINNQYKNLWTQGEISIIKSLLEISINKKKNGENYDKYIESIESILDDKDIRVKQILFKNNTNII
tara:strand:- start:478 stop:1158 length:681 start_codon:yes stop_codon:yes gene_type:complete